jgi:DNA repair protein RecO (recombination protein O)
MGIEKIEAVVMRSFPLRETSRVVHLLSAERGRIHVVAKGVRGPRSRFGAALEPFTRIGAVIYYRAERDLQFMSQAEILARRPALPTSINRFAYASGVIELVDQALAGEEPVPVLFALVDSSLETLERVPEVGLRAAFMGYVARLVSVLGYRPELEHCVSCRNQLDGGIVFFAAARGGTTCRTCAGADAVRLSQDARSRLRGLLDGVEPGELPRGVGDEMARALGAFLRAHVPRYRGLRSLKVMQSGAEEPALGRADAPAEPAFFGAITGDER